jgi:hypothetical protein
MRVIGVRWWGRIMEGKVLMGLSGEEWWNESLRK